MEHSNTNQVFNVERSTTGGGLPTPAGSSPVPSVAELDASKLVFNLTSSPKAVPAADDRVRNDWSFCTDHMVTARWTSETGWETPELRAYGPLALMPNASVLHYATECFEGLKAYRGFDGRLRLFRPDLNAQRMFVSAERVCLPTFDKKEFEKLVFALMEVDGSKFLPVDQPGKFIYIRPTLIATEACLGLKVPTEALLFIVASYMADFSEPKHGLRLVASEVDEIRAWPGGHGFAKVGANYAPTLKALQVAQQKGYDQVLWLFGPDATVTEAGGSNFFIVMKSKQGRLRLQTAPASDRMILDGVVRRSILALARERLTDDSTGLEPLEVVEESFTMAELADAFADGRLVEAFTCGTAYFVTPISEINHRGLPLEMRGGNSGYGAYAATFKSWLSDIIYGKTQHPWAPVVNEPARK